MLYSSRLCLLAHRCLCASGDVGCGVVPLSCRRTARLSLLIFCLLDVCRRMSRRFAPSSRQSCLTACRLSLRSSARASSRFISLSISVPLPSHGISPPRPAPSTRRAGRYDGVAAVPSALLACPSARHPIRAVRHRMATVGSVLASLDCPCLFPPHGHHRCRLLPARSPNPISLPSGRPTVLPPHHLIASPPRSLDTGDGAGFFVSAACLSFGSFATAV